MNVLIVDNGSIYIDRLQQLLKPATYCTINYSYLDQLDDLDSYDLIVLSGGSVNPVIGSGELYDQEIELIKKAKIPIVGICLGFELIAFTFGSEIEMLSNRTKGLTDVHILDSNDPIFKNIPEYIKTFDNHTYSVKALSPELISLGESEHGIEIIRHRTRPIYGFQFHPEMERDKSDGDEIFKNLILVSYNQSNANK